MRDLNPHMATSKDAALPIRLTPNGIPYRNRTYHGWFRRPASAIQRTGHNALLDRPSNLFSDLQLINYHFLIVGMPPLSSRGLFPGPGHQHVPGLVRAGNGVGFEPTTRCFRSPNFSNSQAPALPLSYPFIEQLET